MGTSEIKIKKHKHYFRHIDESCACIKCGKTRKQIEAESQLTMPRITDTHIYFWGSFLSNWIPMDLAIKYDGHEFATSEQLFMYKKAVFFGDTQIAARILLFGNHPKNAKDLGRQVRGYSEEKWASVREQMMYDSNYAKFSQYPELKKQLIDTYPKILVEGSPFDAIWGVMIKWDDDRILDEKNWKGQNLLGKVLMKVREDLMAK